MPQQDGRVGANNADPSTNHYSPLTANFSSHQPISKHTSSQEVEFAAVCAFIAPWLEAVDSWPLLGTPAWQQLPPDDPARWASVLDAALRDALQQEGRWQALAEASHAVSTTADWGAVGWEARRRNEFRAEKPWLKRVAS